MTDNDTKTPGEASDMAADGPGPVILCADDYGLAAGVSRGIIELAEAGRISATSAIVTFPRWPEDARRLADIRPRISVGLHIMLTLGRAVGPMPRLAPDGLLPSVGALVRKSLLRQIEPEEVRAEVTRQLDRFERATGFLPDHIDGHQHAHALPGVRQGVLEALAARFGQVKPLVRDPGDAVLAILRRGGEKAKALAITGLSFGFGTAARARGFPVNRGFSGVSAFDTSIPYANELTSALRTTGTRHIVMCHPGHPDEELRRIEPVVERRAQELAVLRDNPELLRRIWRPDRTSAGAPIDWRKALCHGS